MTESETSLAHSGATSGDKGFGPGERVGVRLTLPLPTGRSGVYDYRVGPGQYLQRGQLVRVPLGPRVVSGVIWGAGEGRVADDKLRDVAETIALAPLSIALLDFTDWLARYTLSPPGPVLRMVLSVPEALDPPKAEVRYRPALWPDGLKHTPARDRVWDAFGKADAALTAPEIARAAEVSTGVVAGLRDAGALQRLDIVEEATFPEPDPARSGPTLSDEQATAAEALTAAVGQGFEAFLLDGVTGSGKTEVYLEAVAAALKAGRQVLVLLPEIALGSQWLTRFADRFGAEPAQWHSDLTPKQRRETWRAVAQGRAKVVVAARSGLFLPFPDLGLIVVDEEHDSSFKQEDGVIYNARDMAVVRAHLTGIPIVLASATPALETHVNAETGRYRRLVLPGRHGGASLPDIKLVDMRKAGLRADQWLAPEVIAAVEETLGRDEQALLFINRRGYAPLTLCRTCGHRLQCPSCSAWLVEHRRLGRLQCHHCGFQTRLPELCPNCEAEDSLVACGPGVERLAEEAVRLFPDARLLVAASDTVQSPAQAAELVRAVEDGEVNLIVGTQIVAKGYHFPRLTLVGVVDGDLGLSGGDLRAGERTFQLLSQVAGRAGRADRPGRVLVQTFAPESAVMRAFAKGDREGFLEAERQGREAAVMPPFGRLVALIVSDVSEPRAAGLARDLARSAPRETGFQVLGPAPAPLNLLRGRYRFRLLVKCPKDLQPQALIRRWVASRKIANTARIQVDVDPYSFF